MNVPLIGSYVALIVLSLIVGGNLWEQTWHRQLYKTMPPHFRPHWFESMVVRSFTIIGVMSAMCLLIHLIRSSR